MIYDVGFDESPAVMTFELPNLQNDEYEESVSVLLKSTCLDKFADFLSKETTFLLILKKIWYTSSKANVAFMSQVWVHGGMMLMTLSTLVCAEKKEIDLWWRYYQCTIFRPQGNTINDKAKHWFWWMCCQKTEVRKTGEMVDEHMVDTGGWIIFFLSSGTRGTMQRWPCC